MSRGRGALTAAACQMGMPGADLVGGVCPVVTWWGGLPGADLGGALEDAVGRRNGQSTWAVQTLWVRWAEAAMN